MHDKIQNSFERLRKYCESEKFRGWDPYDGLNSKLFQAIPLLNKNRYTRLFWIQLFKKLPFNLRKAVLIEKDYNPKGLGLFLGGYCNLYKIKPSEDNLKIIYFLIDKLLELQSKGWSGSCWGYNFNWQARAFYQPKYTPTVVATSFIGYSLLDAYEITKEKKILDVSRSVCDFILKDLNRTYDDKGNFAFSYSPLDRSVVFNASLLGSRILARTYHYTKEKILIEEAKKSVEFCCNYQKNDGSWSYGTLPYHKWIDNFHTGYNLECISEYQKYSGDLGYSTNIERGLRYYLNTFFTDKGISKYYSDSMYPIDVHSPAQLIITLYRLNKLTEYLKLAEKVLSWTIDHMQDKEGYYYYQIQKYFTSKIPYIRWAQGWMFYALSCYMAHMHDLKNSQKKNEKSN